LVTCALVRRVPITGPKSTVSFQAGLRASGNGSTSVTRPVRMSTAKNPSAPTSGFGAIPSGAYGWRSGSISCCATPPSCTPR
jgi:hypothetical protein